MDKYILDSLIEYKKIVDENKSSPNTLSTYKVNKPWGYELWLEVNAFYVMKLIHMKAGKKCSLQSHKKKLETNYILDGSVTVQLENKDGKLEELDLHVNEGWTVAPNQKHRVVAKTDYTAIEVSTTHLNDVVRYEDDTNRKSGKIESEHTK